MTITRSDAFIWARFLRLTGLLLVTCSLALGGTTGCKRKRHKRYKEHKRDKKHKKFKQHVPDISVSQAKESPKGIGKYLFKACVKKDFDAVKKLLPKKDEISAFASEDLLKNYGNSDKMKEKFRKWKDQFRKARFKKVKAKSDDRLKLTKDKAPEKFKKLAEALTAEATIQPAKVFGKKKNGTKVKCAYVALKVKDGWRLLRLKGCKKTD
jgi:hypothetical protein